ncbi:MAG: acetyl-CoA carboxylase biotin carboxyl carrier protein subunit [Mucinivorans sp.]
MTSGQEVITLEAMKMEIAVTTNYKGTVKQLFVKDGDTVATDAPLMEIE